MEKEKVTMKSIEDALKSGPEAMKKLQASALLSAVVRAAMLSYHIVPVKRSINGLDSFTYHGLINLHHSYPVTLGGRACPMATFECMVNERHIVLEASPLPLTDVVPPELRGVSVTLGYVDAMTGKTTRRGVCRLRVPPEKRGVLEHALRMYNARAISHQVEAFNDSDITVRIVAYREYMGDEIPSAVNELVAQLLTSLAGSSRRVYEQLLSPRADDEFVKLLTTTSEVGEGDEDDKAPRQAVNKNRTLCEPLLGMEFIPPAILQSVRDIVEGKSDVTPHNLIHAAIDYSRGVHMYSVPEALPETPEEGLALVAKAKAGEDVKNSENEASGLFVKESIEDAAKMHTLMVFSESVKGGDGNGQH